ncbi:hypothetical protein BU17DRAFT_99234 [Hysterangium stoloniferum]|nr:hypothetical protein BU17DRAFT_99234 [Hysterangium stoloniferum]
MPTLTVDDCGTQLFYCDTGPLPNPTYVTLFLIHGHTFYSPIFKRLLPTAPKRNIRLVLITRRDYPGSTPYSLEDLQFIRRANVDMRIDFLKHRTREIASFMDKFIRENSIPKASPDKSQGGVVLAGWSMGNVQGLAVPGLARFLPRELVRSLEPYLKSYIMYECPNYSLGIPSPPSLYHPVCDPNIPPEKKTAAFTTWISGYFKHPGLVSGDFKDLEYVKPSPHRRSTWSSWSPEETTQITDSTAGPRSDDPFSRASPEMMARIKADVFYPAEVVWPKVDVKLIWTEETVWSIVYGMYMLRRELDVRKKRHPDQWMRFLTVESLPAANHFAHWDDPEKLMDVFSKLVRS